MESNKRLLAKSVTWQISGFVVMSLIGFIFTGSISAGSGIAVTGALIGFVSYFLHELIWGKVRWGRGASSGAEIERA